MQLLKRGHCHIIDHEERDAGGIPMIRANYHQKRKQNWAKKDKEQVPVQTNFDNNKELSS